MTRTGLGALMAVLLFALGGLQVWTQVLAMHYGYHAMLGTPVWQRQAFYRQHSVYWPWKALLWQWHWGGTAWQGGLVFGGLAVVLLTVAMVGIQRRRARTQPPAMEGHGQTQWATKRDLRKAGLL